MDKSRADREGNRLDMAVDWTWPGLPVREGRLVGDREYRKREERNGTGRKPTRQESQGYGRMCQGGKPRSGRESRVGEEGGKAKNASVDFRMCNRCL